jgi:hypothetical protein
MTTIEQRKNMTTKTTIQLFEEQKARHTEFSQSNSQALGTLAAEEAALVRFQQEAREKIGTADAAELRKKYTEGEEHNRRVVLELTEKLDIVATKKLALDKAFATASHATSA